MKRQETGSRIPKSRRYFAGLFSLGLFFCSTSYADSQQALEENGPDRSHTDVKSTDQEAAKESEDRGNNAALSDSEIRVLGASEDPMAFSIRRLITLRDEDAKPEPTGFDIYGSLQIRYREQEGADEFQDGGSRIGTKAYWQIRKHYYMFGRYEAGFNLLSNLDSRSEPGEETGQIRNSFFTRLAYVGMDTPLGYLVAGKNWSTYYAVAGLTDRFSGTGGSASGTYNAQTDGGATGTGRADRVLQSKLSLKFLPHTLFQPFQMNFQFQNGRSIPFGGGADYGTTFGVSALMSTQNNFTLGVAYNHADIDLDRYASLRDIGISGSARALLIGASAFGEKWYAGLVVSRLENHETTDKGIYFHGWGSELYAEYKLFDRIWVVGGYNKLKPDSDQVQAGAYQVKYAVLELRYSFADFRRLVFANVRFNDSIRANGTPSENIYTVGLKWNLSKHGWQRANQ